MAGFVYLIRNGDLHKIGRTDNLQRRFKQLQPDEIVQVLETDRSRDLEHELHEQFKVKRLPQTEYFRLDEAEVNQVRIALGWEPDGPVELPAQPEPFNLADARTFVQVSAIATGVFGLVLVAEGVLMPSDSNFLVSLLFGILGLPAFIGFAIALIALGVTTLGYGGMWGWHKLRQGRG
ncbi:GIY-YIG nuclease family protein [Synechococcus sp. LA31]|uniref:GIY-YIG nuclease family protein n=1 Tax=Synechococcus sp. LA31 TaxID=2741953 RepID=UPI001BDD49C5|nr:GIY-YIG nuclease family protein [Synechococcus sp. LA31]QVV66757.1 GIY-YIG nuclease family protein [Synechococcus sp. LA31]